MDVPFRIYMGHVPAAEAWPLLLHQLAWILALVLIGRLLLTRGVHKLVIQGG